MPDQQPQAPTQTPPAPPPAPAPQPTPTPQPAPAAPTAPAAPAAPAPAPAAPAAPESVLAPKPADPAAPAAPTRGPDGKFLPKAAEPAPEAAPVPIELKLPQGAKLDEKLLGEFKTIMGDPKTTVPQKAQALIDLQLRAGAAQQKSLDEQMKRNRVQDLETLKGDPKYGGAFFDQTRDAARSILSKTASGPAVSKKLEMYGLDCDPDFVKLFAEFRSLVAEDTTSGRMHNAAPEVAQRPQTQTERVAGIYKNQPKK